mmetsp:Transcript_7740/g.24822  ORF Transcript_7740/g.24822 Transcript_7740/m.24822 type:complete len:419 (+) Transcript_7740:374-1630(+)
MLLLPSILHLRPPSFPLRCPTTMAPCTRPCSSTFGTLWRWNRRTLRSLLPTQPPTSPPVGRSCPPCVVPTERLPAPRSPLPLAAPNCQTRRRGSSHHPPTTSLTSTCTFLLPSPSGRSRLAGNVSLPGHHCPRRSAASLSTPRRTARGQWALLPTLWTSRWSATMLSSAVVPATSTCPPTVAQPHAAPTSSAPYSGASVARQTVPQVRCSTALNRTATATTTIRPADAWHPPPPTQTSINIGVRTFRQTYCRRRSIPRLGRRESRPLHRRESRPAVRPPSQPAHRPRSRPARRPAYLPRHLRPHSPLQRQRSRPPHLHRPCQRLSPLGPRRCSRRRCRRQRPPTTQAPHRRHRRRQPYLQRQPCFSVRPTKTATAFPTAQTTHSTLPRSRSRRSSGPSSARRQPSVSTSLRAPRMWRD